MSAVQAIDLVPTHFGQRRNAAKVLSRISGASERAAKNWLARKNSPQAEHILRIAAHCDELKKDLDRMIEEEKARSHGTAWKMAGLRKDAGRGEERDAG